MFQSPSRRQLLKMAGALPMAAIGQLGGSPEALLTAAADGRQITDTDLFGA